MLIARTAADAGALLAAMRREILALEPNAVFLDNQTMEAQVAANLLPARLAAQTLGLVGAGRDAARGGRALRRHRLRGRTAHARDRHPDGARRDAARRAAPGDGPGPGDRGAGVGIGLALSWVAARAIASALYGVGAADPAAWVAAVAVMLASAALANYLPARRAARVDPSVR